MKNVTLQQQDIFLSANFSRYLNKVSERNKFAFNFDSQTVEITQKALVDLFSVEIAVTNLLWNLVQTPERSTECLLCFYAKIELNFLKLSDILYEAHCKRVQLLKNTKLRSRIVCSNPFRLNLCTLLYAASISIGYMPHLKTSC